MEALFLSARAAWPGVDLAPEVFASYLERRLNAGDDAAQALRQLRVNDLYLACACARGDARALAAFERSFLAPLGATLRRLFGVTPDVVDDVQQQLRQTLLVSDARPPGIEAYSGRGDLRRWLRVIAVREALSIVRKARREVSWDDDDDHPCGALLPVLDLEKQYLKKRYQKELCGAVTDALSNLADRDRVVLRWAYVDGLNIDEIGRLYGVHRATAARWLSRAEQALSTETRAILMKRLAVSAADLHGILAAVGSGLELSLPRVFGRQRSAPRRNSR